MKHLLASFSFIVAAFAFTGTGAHAQPTQSYTPGPFDRVAISGIARVELSQGDKDIVTVVGDSDVQRVVQLDLSGRELRVRTDGDWKFWNREPVLLRVQMREIRQLAISGLSDIVATKPIRTDELRISISGRGDVRLSELVADKLRFEISGAGDGEVSGKVEELVLRVSGAGKFNAEKLKTQRAGVTISGAGNTDLWVQDELRITVTGVGNVSYWGNPRVRQNISTMANVNARGDKR